MTMSRITEVQNPVQKMSFLPPHWRLSVEKLQQLHDFYGVFSHGSTPHNLVSALNLFGFYNMDERLLEDPIFLL